MSARILWRFLLPFFLHFTLCFHTSHSSTCLLCEIFCLYTVGSPTTFAALCINSSMNTRAVCRHISCLFHTWLVFVFSFRHHPLTQTHTHTQNGRTYKLVRTRMQSLISWRADRLWCTVLSLSRSHYFCHASLSSALTCVSLTTRAETPATTVSSNLNVAILQSHFQLCFSGFRIKGEIVQPSP